MSNEYKQTLNNTTAVERTADGIVATVSGDYDHREVVRLRAWRDEHHPGARLWIRHQSEE